MPLDNTFNIDDVEQPGQIEYDLIMSREDARKALTEIAQFSHVALDFETTSLRPEDGVVRLTSITTPDWTYLFDHFSCGSFESMVDDFLGLGCVFLVFNAGFEYRWFDYFRPEKVELWDIQFMRKAKLGGWGGASLARQIKLDLKIELPKDEQSSNWSDPYLTQSQLNYAAYDSYITWMDYEYWNSELTTEQWGGFTVFNDAVRGNIEMEDSGLWLDTGIHAKNLRVWQTKAATAKRYFERFTPPSIIANINSKKQMSDFLKRELHPDTLAQWPTTPKGKQLSLERETLLLACQWLPYPMNRWLLAYVIYSYWTKYIGTYGQKLIDKQNFLGKVTYRLNMAAARTGRYSSSSENIQNIPRKPYIRRAFRVNPRTGELMVLADYSGIEVRTLAELSGDEQLIHDTIFGNVHGEGAALIQGIDSEEYMAVLADDGHKYYYRFKEWRNQAKVFTFRLTYGAGLGALSLSLKKGIKETQEALEKWATRYPKAYNYRFNMQEHMNHDGFIPVCDGRTIYVPKPDRALPVAANYPIQGAAASVMYRAVYHTRREYIEHDVDATLAASVHDELLSYSAEHDAERALECKLRGMEQGWLDIFPGTSTDNLIESAIGKSWAAKP